MLKKVINLFLIWTILIVGSFSSQVSAQTSNNSLQTKPVSGFLKNPSTTDLKDFNKEIIKSRFDLAGNPIDAKKIAKAEANSLPKRQISKKDKIFLTVFLVGLGVLVFLVAKYGKPVDCETNPPYCFPDEVCPCP